LPFNTSNNLAFKENKQTDLSKDDFQKIELILTKCIDEYNLNQEKQFIEINNKYPEYKSKKKNFIIDLKQYKRQYVATINSKGEKEIWVNCFCNTCNKNWKTNLLIVHDGGNCYFNLKINLAKKTYYELTINGDS
jgi:hypothetical protein